MRRTLIWIVGVIIVGVGLIVAVSLFVLPRLGGGPVEASGVWVQTVGPGELIEVVSAPGIVEPLTKVEISARVSARIIRLPFRAGQSVQGEGHTDGPSLLVELDASDIQAQLESAQKRREGLVAQVVVEQKRITGLEATLSGSQTVRADLAREFERQQALHQTGDVSEKALDQARRAMEEAESRYLGDTASLEAARLGLEVSGFNIEAADADIRQIREALAYTTIYSPIDGVVTRLNVDVGEIAITGTMNNPGTVLLEIADLSRMLVVARVDEANIRDVAVGQTAEVRLSAYPGRVFVGEVQSVALAADREQGQYFETEILLEENEDLVRTGLSADVEIKVRAHTDAILVPSQAVLSRPVDSLPAQVRKDNPLIDPSRSNTIVVFRIVDGEAIATPVRIGASDSQNTMILEGLGAESQIVTGPFALLEGLAHGQAVHISRRDGVEVKPTLDPAAPQSAAAVEK